MDQPNPQSTMVSSKVSHLRMPLADVHAVPVRGLTEHSEPPNPPPGPPSSLPPPPPPPSLPFHVLFSSFLRSHTELSFTYRKVAHCVPLQIVTSRGFPLLSTQELICLLTSLRIYMSVSPDAAGASNVHSGQ